MIIYIDENMPPKFADGLQSLQDPVNKTQGVNIEVRSIEKHFKKAVEDEVWIPKIGKEKACVITQDLKIQRVRHQFALCKKHKVGVFFFKPAKGTKYWERLKLLIKYWPDVCKKALKRKQPFAYEIKPRAGLKELSI